MSALCSVGRPYVVLALTSVGPESVGRSSAGQHYLTKSLLIPTILGPSLLRPTPLGPSLLRPTMLGKVYIVPWSIYSIMVYI